MYVDSVKNIKGVHLNAPGIANVFKQSLSASYPRKETFKPLISKDAGALTGVKPSSA
jgi:hypothetical protein